jgi:hypothetical protein
MMSEQQITQILTWMGKIDEKLDDVMKRQQLDTLKRLECEDYFDMRYERKRDYAKGLELFKNALIAINTIVILLVFAGVIG